MMWWNRVVPHPHKSVDAQRCGNRPKYMPPANQVRGSQGPKAPGASAAPSGAPAAREEE
jgi:hypothetical protein